MSELLWTPHGTLQQQGERMGYLAWPSDQRSGNDELTVQNGKLHVVRFDVGAPLTVSSWRQYVSAAGTALTDYQAGVYMIDSQTWVATKVLEGGGAAANWLLTSMRDGSFTTLGPAATLQYQSCLFVFLAVGLTGTMKVLSHNGLDAQTVNYDDSPGMWAAVSGTAGYTSLPATIDMLGGGPLAWAKERAWFALR